MLAIVHRILALVKYMGQSSDGSTSGYKLLRMHLLLGTWVNRLGASTLPKDPLVGAHPRRPSYRDERAAVRVAIAYEVRERRPSRAPAMPLTSNPENRPAGINHAAGSVTK